MEKLFQMEHFLLYLVVFVCQETHVMKQTFTSSKEKSPPFIDWNFKRLMGVATDTSESAESGQQRQDMTYWTLFINFLYNNFTFSTMNYSLTVVNFYIPILGKKIAGFVYLCVSQYCFENVLFLCSFDLSIDSQVFDRFPPKVKFIFH